MLAVSAVVIAVFAVVIAVFAFVFAELAVLIAVLELLIAVFAFVLAVSTLISTSSGAGVQSVALFPFSSLKPLILYSTKVVDSLFIWKYV